MPQIRVPRLKALHDKVAAAVIVVVVAEGGSAAEAFPDASGCEALEVPF